MRVALVTGAAGFVGSHLCEALQEQGWEVHGLLRRPRVVAYQTHVADVLDPEALQRVVERVRPTHVFHLAAAVGPVSTAQALALSAAGTAHLLEGCSALSPVPWVLVASSGAVYGSTTDTPVREDAPLRPTNAYAVGKAAQEMVALAHESTRTGPVVRARTFNVVGPRMPSTSLLGRLADAVVEAERTSPADSRTTDVVLDVGDLDLWRDYVDVRDVVRAFVRLTSADVPSGAYNVCSGVAASLRSCLETVLANTRVRVVLRERPAQRRPGDILFQVGSPDRLRAATTWQPEIGLRDSLTDMLEERRACVELPHTRTEAGT